MNGRIPAGGSGKGGININSQQLESVLRGGLSELDTIDISSYHGKGSVESEGSFEIDEVSLSERAKKRGLRALGTLGSGNHFLELQRVSEIADEETSKAWGVESDKVIAMIHSGSRGLGHQVSVSYTHLTLPTNREV